MAEQFIRIERSHAVAIVRLDRPPLNAMSEALLEQVADLAHDLASDAAVRAVVVTGSDRAFAAGADIAELEHRDPHDIADSFRAAFDAVAAIPRPVIAAVRGIALGGGLELALACDLRVAAETARLGQPEVQLGIIPGAGATQRLARLVGPARAKDLIWSGRHVRGDEALTIGLVDRVVPSDDVESVALDWAGNLATGATAAMALAKAAIDRGLDRSLAAGLDLERDAFVEVWGTADARTGIRSFLEHGPGKATFEGR